MSPSPQIGCGDFPEDVVRLLRRKREEGPSPGSYRHCRRRILHRYIARFMASRYFPDLQVPIYHPFSTTTTFELTFFKVRHVPAWIPGAGFKRVAERYRRTNLDQSYRPLEFVKRRLVSV